ncbi:MAG: hypothetical protein K6E11_01975 [Bacilli bacterium]|nr:hypothetical protein [Bacilli bacterium]
MFKFLKQHKFTILLTALNALLLSAAVIGTVAWYSIKMEIDPPTGTTQTSGILKSYFDSGSGTQGDPYVITRPIHFYHLSYLQNSDYFGDSTKYFRFGKNIDGDANGEYEFYNYGDDGKLLAGTSKELNVKYYSGTNALYPIGTPQHPFKSVIYGTNLTVKNVHIKGDGLADIGVFGYVHEDAEIHNLYFDTVSIDTGTPTSSNGTHSHTSGKYNVGYLAGHIQSSDSFDNVYVNKCEIYNSGIPNIQGLTEYGYFGKCDSIETPLTTSSTDEYRIDPATVQGYFKDNWTSGKQLSSKSVTTRNTEYTVKGTDFTSVVNSSDNNHNASTSYTMKGTASSVPHNYSLSTIGHQGEETSYEISYSSSHLNMDVSTTVIPDGVNINTITEPGSYMYWDTSASKWVYYVISPGGSTSSKTFNVFSLSYQYNGNTYYVYVSGNVTESNGVKNYSGLSLAVSSTVPSISNRRYWFSLRSSNTDYGITSIATNSGAERYYLFCPDVDAYAYITSNTTINFGNYSTVKDLSGTGSSKTFTFDGVDTKIEWVGSSNTNYGFQATSSSITAIRPVSGNDATIFALNGTGARTSESSSDTDKYQLVTDTSQLKNNQEYSIGYDAGDLHRLIGEQRTNNRTAVTVTVDSGTTLNSASGVRKFTLGVDDETITGSTVYSFFDQAEYTGNGGYLYAASSSHNYLRTQQTNNLNGLWSITFGSGGAATVTAQGSNSRNLLRYNSSDDLFASYGQGQKLVKIYKYIAGSGTIQTANHAELIATVEDGTDVDPVPYDAFYDADTTGGTNYQSITFTRERITWDFTNHLITISPQSNQHYERITSIDDLSDGEYLIVTESGGKALNGQGSGGASASVTITNHTIPYNETTTGYAFTLDSENGRFLAKDSYYIYSAGSGTSMSYTQTESDLVNHSISFDGNNVVIKSPNNNRKLAYYSSGPNFRYYASIGSGQEVQLYKLISETTEPEYIADTIATLDNKYNKDKIDAVGTVTYSSSSMTFASNLSNIKAVSKWNTENSELGIGAKFYQTRYLSNSLVLFVPNQGALDFGTIHLESTGTAPVFVKGSDNGITNFEPSIGFTDARIGCTDDLVGDSNHSYTLSLNMHNIFNLCYAALDSDGKILASYDTDGAKVLPATAINPSNIATFVLAISVPSSSMSVSAINLKIRHLEGEMANFSNVGYRNATYTSGATIVDSIVTDNVNTTTSTIAREAIDFRIDSGSNSNKIFFRMMYNATTKTYDITFKCTSNTHILIFNFDAERVKLYLNDSQLTESYHDETVSGTAWTYPVALPSNYS